MWIQSILSRASRMLSHEVTCLLRSKVSKLIILIWLFIWYVLLWKWLSCRIRLLLPQFFLDYSKMRRFSLLERIRVCFLLAEYADLIWNLRSHWIVARIVSTLVLSYSWLVFATGFGASAPYPCERLFLRLIWIHLIIYDNIRFRLLMLYSDFRGAHRS